MRSHDRFLRVELQPGLFRNEYTVILSVQGRTISSLIPKDHVRVKREPSQTMAGEGLLGVRILDQRSGEALVDLPSPAFTSEPRVRIPVSDLIE